MDSREGSSRFTSAQKSTLRNLSSSSSAFYSANHSPFMSPKSPTFLTPEQARSEIPVDGNISPVNQIKLNLAEISENKLNSTQSDSHQFTVVSSSSVVSNSTISSFTHDHHVNGDGYHVDTRKHQKTEKSYGHSYTPARPSFSANRIRSCDVYIGLHGRNPSLLRFSNWLRSELEVHGVSCFVSDRARCSNSRKRSLVETAMNVASFGVVILTRKSFRNRYTIEELQYFSGKKNLVPVFFDLGPGDCLIRDIIEKRGDIWEQNGGQLWLTYGGLEKSWREAVGGISRVDDWKLEAHDGKWRDCIFRAVTLLAMRLGRRSVVERLTRWKERVEREEFPFPRNENFIGRKKELSELEFILFGNVSGESEKDYFELEAKTRRKSEVGDGKGKQPMIWKESEKDIEMESPRVQPQNLRPKSSGRHGRRKRSKKILYGKGIACVSGESGIGKTEVLLEFAHTFHQRYKTVLWIGGESRYIRQNYLNLWPFLEVDVGMEGTMEKSRIQSFEEREDAAISRIRKEMMRNIPFLVVIDNLESEKDWWDHKLVMDLLPRFGGETHVIISTRLPHTLNLEPLKLSYLSSAEAMYLMQGTEKQYPVAELDALRVIEEKLGRLTLGLAIIGSILSELPINPSKLLDTINRMPLTDFTCSGREGNSLKKNTFLLQLFEVCLSIFDHADGPKNLATRMVQAAGWFAPAAVPVSLLSIAAKRMPVKRTGPRLLNRLVHSLTCGCASAYSKRSESEASSMLTKFNIARTSTKPGCIQFNELVMVYARKRAVTGVAHAVVEAVISRRGSIPRTSEHLWAACFLVLGFRNDPIVVELKVPDLLIMVKEVVLPLAIDAFLTFSRCSAAMDLLRLCTNMLESADQAFVTPVETWLDKPLCWKPMQSNAQLNPCLWQELALSRATILETRARLMIKGGQFDIGDDLIRKAIYVRTSICGESHPTTVAAREILSKITRLLADAENHTSS